MSIAFKPRHEAIDPNLFINHRKRLAEQLLPGSIALLCANDLFPANADAWLPFVQHSDLYYLTGIHQAETLLMLYPDAPDPQHRELLFIKPADPKKVLWEGPHYTKASATTCSGIAQVHTTQAFEGFLHRLAPTANHLYLPTNEHGRHTPPGLQVATRRLIATCQEHYPLHTYHRLAPLLSEQRMIKSSSEIELIKRACQITQEGFRSLLTELKPGFMEYALEASLIHHFLSQGAEGFAFAPIVASGPRACMLHYGDNSHPCQAGELVLIDAGADYAGYKADMTRVFPVSGRFTPRQREVYLAVLSVLQGAKQLLRPGSQLREYEQSVGALMEEALVDLGLITTQEIAKQDPKHPAYKRYFMHSCSHHLGLDTHDVCNRQAPLAQGMVLTVEPGIYIPEEGLGIRLENDVVLTEQGILDLMEGSPLHPEEIEELMQA